MAAFIHILIFILSWNHIATSREADILHDRIKRVVPPLLVFPPTSPTRVQLIFGIGIPEGDLDFESLTNGWVLKYEYNLPTNATDLYVPSQLAISGRSVSEISSKDEQLTVEAVLIDTGFLKLETISESDNIESYKIEPEFEDFSETRDRKKRKMSGYRWAAYKALEAAANRKGLAGRDCVLKSICETAKTPFHYNDGLFSEIIYILLTPSTTVDEISCYSDNEYFQAEIMGKSGAPCDGIFKDCKKSLVDIFTNVLDIVFN